MNFASRKNKRSTYTYILIWCYAAFHLMFSLSSYRMITGFSFEIDFVYYFFFLLYAWYVYGTSVLCMMVFNEMIKTNNI